MDADFIRDFEAAIRYTLGMTTLFHSLKTFYKQHRHSDRLYLVRVLSTKGSSFQKKGAAMMVDLSDQVYQGLISGGCFEKDVMAHCEVMSENQTIAVILEYDLGSEQDILFGTGVGCPGTITLLIEKVVGKLKEILDKLYVQSNSISGEWRTSVGQDLKGKVHVRHSLGPERMNGTAQCNDESLVAEMVEQWHGVRRFVIVGQGEVVKSLSEMCRLMHFEHEIWTTVAVNPSDYPYADDLKTVQTDSIELPEYFYRSSVDIVLLTHNLNIDLEILKALSKTPVTYIGVMGARKRMQLIEEKLPPSIWQKLKDRIKSPVGEPIGGREPQQIALSIVIEFHKNSFQFEMEKTPEEVF